MIALSLSSLFSAAVTTSCCSLEEVQYDDWLAPALTRLEYEDSDQGRLYRLPESCWPDETREDELLPNRSREPLFTGLDAVAIDNFRILKQRRFALLTNATGKDRNLKPGLDLMIAAGVRPALVFEPEHGLFGHSDEISRRTIRTEPRYGLRVLSLYSQLRKPTPEHLEGIDLIVIDVQNLPVRCYTYISTITYLMEVAEQTNIEVLILDRPNPYSFWRAQGSFLVEDHTSFVGTAPVPFVYSLTPGEYARYMKAARFPRLRLSVVAVAGYSREHVDAPLRAAWINPSPNIPSLESALVYPGVVLYEGVRFSLGRGTTRPFVYSGAPWMDATEVLRRMEALDLPGVQLSEVSFQPSASQYQGQICYGLQITPVSTSFDSLRTGYEYMRIVRQLHPTEWSYISRADGQFWMDALWGGTGYRDALEANLSYEEFRSLWEEEARAFQRLVEPHRLY